MSDPNDQNDPNFDWNRVDPEWVLTNKPLKLTERHRAVLTQKYGVDGALAKIQESTILALRSVRLAPPYKGGR